MISLRIPLLAMLLLVTMLTAGAGSVAAQDNSEDGPSRLRVEMLKNGVWLSWERGQGRYSHQRIAFYQGRITTPEDERVFSYQDEKANASYGFISYSDLEFGEWFTFQIDGMRGKNDIASSWRVEFIMPIEGMQNSYSLKPAMATTHPGGLSVTKSESGDEFTFEWTMGINPEYEHHKIKCRDTKVNPIVWRNAIPTNKGETNEIKRVSYTTSLDEFGRGTRPLCRVMMIAEDGSRGPMTNWVKVKRK